MLEIGVGLVELFVLGFELYDDLVFLFFNLKHLHLFIFQRVFDLGVVRL